MKAFLRRHGLQVVLTQDGFPLGVVALGGFVLGALVFDVARRGGFESLAQGLGVSAAGLFLLLGGLLWLLRHARLRACPACGALMERVPTARAEASLVQRCPACGEYFVVARKATRGKRRALGTEMFQAMERRDRQ